MIVYFKAYLHDTSYTEERVEALASQGLAQEIAEEIAGQRPFYELELQCEYNTDNKQVIVRSARSTQ